VAGYALSMPAPRTLPPLVREAVADLKARLRARFGRTFVRDARLRLDGSRPGHGRLRRGRAGRSHIPSHADRVAPMEIAADVGLPRGPVTSPRSSASASRPTTTGISKSANRTRARSAPAPRRSSRSSEPCSATGASPARPEARAGSDPRAHGARVTRSGAALGARSGHQNRASASDPRERRVEAPQRARGNAMILR
jgi:hypothetical protein